MEGLARDWGLVNWNNDEGLTKQLDTAKKLKCWLKIHLKIFGLLKLTHLYTHCAAVEYFVVMMTPYQKKIQPHTVKCLHHPGLSPTARSKNAHPNLYFVVLQAPLSSQGCQVSPFEGETPSFYGILTPSPFVTIISPFC